MTGAAAVMDCADLIDAFAGLGLPPQFSGRVLDVGCGTGRLARLCPHGYHGVDISCDGVAYATQAGLTADVLEGHAPTALRETVSGDVAWICCLSVFTHISRAERVAYLQVFADLAGRLVVDIIPGDGSGNVALWTAKVEEFETDLWAAGWNVIRAIYERTSPDGVTHRYYRCEP